MDDNKAGWKVLQRVKAKKETEPSEAEQLFKQYCKTQSDLWKEKARRQAALAILSSGIFDGPKLKGHERREDYVPEITGCEAKESFSYLIFELVQAHLNYNVLPSFLRQDIIAEFDDLFGRVASIAHIGGVRIDEIQRIKDRWREKISTRALKGKISPHWKLIVWAGKPLKMAHEFVNILLTYIPKAPPNKIAEWTNAILKSLGQKGVSMSGLYTYISEEKESRSQRTPIQITE